MPNRLAEFTAYFISWDASKFNGLAPQMRFFMCRRNSGHVVLGWQEEVISLAQRLIVQMTWQYTSWSFVVGKHSTKYLEGCLASSVVIFSRKRFVVFANKVVFAQKHVNSILLSQFC